jgi:predicted PurR-regulated permease PerM
MVILALTAGSVLQGILGAFLAVPIAAGIARALDYARLEMGRAALLRPGEA